MTDIKTAARKLIETCIKSATLIGNADQVKRGYVILAQYHGPLGSNIFEGWL